MCPRVPANCNKKTIASASLKLAKTTPKHAAGHGRARGTGAESPVPNMIGNWCPRNLCQESTQAEKTASPTIRENSVREVSASQTGMTHLTTARQRKASKRGRSYAWRFEGQGGNQARSCFEKAAKKGDDSPPALCSVNVQPTCIYKKGR